MSARLLNGPHNRPVIQQNGETFHVVTSNSPVSETDYDTNVVRTTGNQTIAGDKTFTGYVSADGGVYISSDNGQFFIDIYDTGITWSGPPLSKIQTATAAGLSVTAALQGYIVRLNRAAGIAITLPAATAGLTYTFIFETAASGGNTTITAASGDLLIGGVLAVDTDSSNAVAFDDPDGTDDLVMTFNGTTQGGLVGSWVRVTALSATRWFVEGVNRHSGDFATIFS